MQPVTKEIFLSAQNCMTKGWFLRSEEQATTPPSEGDQFRMEQGKEIGRQARSLFPEGVFVPAGAAKDAAAKTKTLMNKATVLFEGTFFIEGYVAKPDILKRSGKGWDVIEVKSSLEDTGQIEDLIDDLA